MKRLLAAAAVLATLTHTAWAGELTLFGDSDFRGPQLTVRNEVRDLRQFNFNDRTSSVIVRAGVWQLCDDSNFNGHCAEFGPGEYRVLPNLNDRVSSLREVVRGGAPGAWQDEREQRREAWREERHEERREEMREEMRAERGYGAGPAVVLFAGPRFEGQEVPMSGDVRNMNEIGFNDRTTSIVIREGRWEFCEHADFRGQCVVFGPGRYPFLEGMNNRISSMRRVR